MSGGIPTNRNNSGNSIRNIAPNIAPFEFASPPRIIIESKKIDSIRANVEGSINVMYEANSEPAIAASPAAITNTVSL